MSEKKSRSPNFTSNERVLLLYLLEEYVSIIENKRTDAVTSKQKEAAWKSLADDFNKNTTSVQRSSEQLKIYYENYKRRVKKATADDKVELYKTGGGTFTKQLDDEGAKLMALLKPQFVPLVNLSDSDAGYHIELPGEEQVEKQSEDCLVNPSHSTIIDNPVVVVCSNSTLMENHQNEPLLLNAQKDLSITNSSMMSPPTKKKKINFKKDFSFHQSNLEGFTDTRCSIERKKIQLIEEKHKMEMKILQTTLEVQETELQIKKAMLEIKLIELSNLKN